MQVQYLNKPIKQSVSFSLGNSNKDWTTAMKISHKLLFATVLAILPVLLFVMPSALAANAANVYVDGHLMVDKTAYDLPSGGTAYYDVAAGILTLNNAQIYDSLYNQYLGDYLIYSDGDLTINLIGTSSMSFYGNVSTVGIYSNGNLSIGGSGSLNITLFGDQGAYLYGILCKKTFCVNSGLLRVSCTSPAMVIALTADVISMEGGTGYFYAKSTGDYQAFGATLSSITKDTKLIYTGGNFSYISNNTNGGSDYYALYYTWINDPVCSITNGAVYVSEYSDGSSESLWINTAESGKLAGNYNSASDFHYVRFEPYITTETKAAIPQTGDSARPWLWIGIAAAAVVGAAAVIVYLRKKHRG